MFSGDFEAGEFASRGVIIYVDGGSYDGELDGRRSVPGPIDPTRLTLPPFQLLSPPEPEPAPSPRENSVTHSRVQTAPSHSIFPPCA